MSSARSEPSVEAVNRPSGAGVSVGGGPVATTATRPGAPALSSVVSEADGLAVGVGVTGGGVADGVALPGVALLPEVSVEGSGLGVSDATGTLPVAQTSAVRPAVVVGAVWTPACWGRSSDPRVTTSDTRSNAITTVSRVRRPPARPE